MQILEELKPVDSSIWKQYDVRALRHVTKGESKSTLKTNVVNFQEKLVSLEQELNNQAENREAFKSEELDSIRIELKTLRNLYAQLKTCCDMAGANVVSDNEIEDKADKVFAGYFGDSFSKQDIVRIFQILNSKIQQEEVQKQTSSAPSPSPEPSASSTTMGINEIRKIVLEILKIYDADKTGRVDYALESAGIVCLQ